MKYDNTAKFTFDYTWRDSDDNLVSRTRHTTADETLGEVLNAFELFLRGAGFHFDGHLEFVDENNTETAHTEAPCAEQILKTRTHDSGNFKMASQ